MKRLFLLLFAITQAWAGVTQKATCLSTSAVFFLDCSFSGTPALNSQIRAGAWTSSTAASIAFTDNQASGGNVYTIDKFVGVANVASIASATASKASGTFTVRVTTGGTAAFLSMTIVEYSGLTQTIDGTPTSASPASQTCDPGAITTTNARDVIIGVGLNQSGVSTTVTPAGSFALESPSPIDGTMSEVGGYQDRTVSATGSYDPVFVFGGLTPASQCVAVAYKEQVVVANVSVIVVGP